jgi:pyruvate,orthophosphate dikinase
MLETTAGALRAARIAEYCDYFSIGSTDLAQSAYGLSRDDEGPIQKAYKAAGLEWDRPFDSIDREVVGSLIKDALDQTRASRAAFPACMCGEQGADPKTIALAPDLGFNCVSVSPFRVSSAILASAQARLQREDAAGPSLVAIRRQKRGI